jgi:hypothetical protein
MATQVFKDGTCVYIEPQDIQNHLNAGWSLDDPNLPKQMPKGIEVINQKETEYKFNDNGAVVAPASESTTVTLPKQRKKPGRKPKAK